MKKILYLVILITNTGLAQEVAITIDDFPFRGESFASENQDSLIEKLYNSLDEFDIKATGFLNTGRIREGNIEGLRLFREKGHDFGNHTHRHFNVDQVGVDAFIADIDSCNVQGKELINSRYFRYPYLRRGKTVETRDAVYDYLGKNNYVIAHVSIDNNEWIYNRDYVKAQATGDSAAMDSIGREYLKHMQNVSLNYQEKAKKLTGRDVKHILLIHANLINAIYLRALLQWYVDQGWIFITLQEALKDPIYHMKEDLVSPHGWSQIDKLVKLQNSGK